MTVAAAGCQSLGIVEVRACLAHTGKTLSTQISISAVVISVHCGQMASAHNPKLPQRVGSNRSVGSALKMARHTGLCPRRNNLWWQDPCFTVHTRPV